MKAQVVAQELVVSQELATMWSDWVRFRLNDYGGTTTPNKLTSADLSGASGDFYEDKDLSGTAKFHIGGGDPSDPPTYHKSIYQGYWWRVVAIVDAQGNPAGAPYSYDPPMGSSPT